MSDTPYNFVARPNVVTGQQDWQFTSDNYDFQQEIARSSYADMLHDTDRNKKYLSGLSKVITDLKSRGERVHVLDIGTGTGLLSMMAVRCGADKVTACEAFEPVSKCAKKVISRNQMSDKIRIISKRSTDLTVEEDLFERANVLVAEVFDTELIGEGALHTFAHAAEHLLTPDAIVIPSSARLYVQVANSDWLWKQHRLEEPSGELKVSNDVKQCSGCPSVYDLQLSELDESQFTPLTSPVEVKRFQFAPPSSQIILRDSKKVTFPVTKTGMAHVFMMWWELDMEPSGQVTLSCAPKWAHSKPEDYHWRDHWMQAVYYPKQMKPLEIGQDVVVSMCHDDYSLWFDFVATDPNVLAGDILYPSDDRLVRPVCICGMHVAWNRTKIAQSGCLEHLSIYDEMIKNLAASQNKLSVVLTDGSLLSWMFGSRGFNCLHIDRNPLSRRFLEDLRRTNPENLGSVKILPGVEQAISILSEECVNIDLVIGEPYFISSLLPWHNLHFWYALESLRPYLSPEVVISPSAMRLKAILVDFRDLWKIRAPVGICEGFDISPFDDMIKCNVDLTDNAVEPQPLWEYPGRPLSEEVTVCDFDLTQSFENISDELAFSSKLSVSGKGSFNGIAFWCEWELAPGIWHSTGLKKTVNFQENLCWNNLCQQGVHLCRSAIDTEEGSWIDMSCIFRKDIGEFDFAFVYCR